jgi:hypothetical protein
MTNKSEVGQPVGMSSEKNDPYPDLDLEIKSK